MLRKRVGIALIVASVVLAAYHILTASMAVPGEPGVAYGVSYLFLAIVLLVGVIGAITYLTTVDFSRPSKGDEPAP